MGYFGSWLFRDGAWTQQPAPAEATGRFLHLDVHDSDITTVRYSPAGSGTGVAYLGVTPRIYFEDPGASDPTDPDREALGLAEWAEPTSGDPASALAPAIRPFLAEDAEVEWDEDEDIDDLDDAEIFVELKTLRFLEVLDVPEPEGFLEAAEE